MQVDGNLLARQDLQSRPDLLGIDQCLHLAGQPLRVVPALVALQAAEQRDRGGELLVVGRARCQVARDLADPVRGIGLEIAVEEAGQQPAVEQAQRLGLAARGRVGRQRLTQQRAPARVVDKTVAVVAPLQYAGGAELLAAQITLSRKDLAGLGVMLDRGRVLAQKTQAGQAITQPRLEMQLRRRQALRPPRKLVELAQCKLAVEHRQQQCAGRRPGLGVEQQVERDIGLAARQESLRGPLQQARTLTRLEAAPAPIEQELAQQWVQSIDAVGSVDALGEQVVRAQVFECLPGIGHPGDGGHQVGRHPGQQGTDQQQALARRAQPFMQQAGEVVEQQRRVAGVRRVRAVMAEQAQAGGPAAHAARRRHHLRLVLPQRTGVQRRFIGAELQRVGRQHRQRAGQNRAAQFGRRRVAAAHEQAHAIGQLGDGAGQQRRQGRQRGLIQVIEDQCQRPRHSRQGGAEPGPRVGQRLAHMFGREARPAGLDAQAVDGLVEGGEEPAEVVVVGIEPVPQAAQRTRLAIRRQQHRLAGSRRRTQPDRTAGPLSVEPVEQALARQRLHEARWAQLGRRGLASFAH